MELLGLRGGPRSIFFLATGCSLLFSGAVRNRLEVGVTSARTPCRMCRQLLQSCSECLDWKKQKHVKLPGALSADQETAYMACVLRSASIASSKKKKSRMCCALALFLTAAALREVHVLVACRCERSCLSASAASFASQLL